MSPQTLPRVYLASSNPLAVLSACKRAALKADWSLAQWVEFSASVRACFTPEALPEESEQMLAIVRSHFDVTLAVNPNNTESQEQTQ